MKAPKPLKIVNIKEMIMISASIITMTERLVATVKISSPGFKEIWDISHQYYNCLAV